MVDSIPEVTMTEDQSPADVSNEAQAQTMQVDESSQQPEAAAVEEESKMPTAVEEESKMPRASQIKVMFPRLNSKLCIATVLGYLIDWDRCVPFFARLNRRGPAYFEQHKPQFRYFIEDKPIQPFEMTFGDKSCQYVSPFPFSRVDMLFLSNIDCDIH